MGANEKSFTSEGMIGNQSALKWTLEESFLLFERMVQNAEANEELLCVQDVVLSVGMYPSSINYLVNKFPELKLIKKDIHEIITCRINRGTLKGDFQPAAGIWRMKQNGERDQQYLDQSSKDGSMSPKQSIDLSKLSYEELRDLSGKNL